jgi:hypothetical protein
MAADATEAGSGLHLRFHVHCSACTYPLLLVIDGRKTLRQLKGAHEVARTQYSP